MTAKRWLLLLAAFTVLTAMAGGRDVESFDHGWCFMRYGLLADGSRIEEEGGIKTQAFDDRSWRRLDLPHDWGIEGPFRQELEGNTAKLPWRGIGWYRKHFTLEKSDLCRRVYLDFDGAMANAQVWVNGCLAGGRPYGYSSFTEGPGKVVATDNGDATCHIIFSETTRPAFNGLLLAIVKPERGEKGKIRLKVTAPGMEGASTVIRVKK